MAISKIGFGGGCHWCTEAGFQSLMGVDKVEQGWIASDGENQAFSEAVIVHFDVREIKIRDLIAIHQETHSSSSNHSMRSKYRSAIYFFEQGEGGRIQSILTKLSEEKGRNFITKVLAFVEFKENKEDYVDYYEKNPDKAFCQRYITPKLLKLKAGYPKFY